MEGQMYLIKNTKSPYYQLVYFVDGKRTTISTKQTKKREAQKFIKHFSIPAPDNLTPKKASTILLSKFHKEYHKYAQSKMSSNYLRTIDLSFRTLMKYTGDIPIHSLSARLLDQFISFTMARTQHGASAYYRTLKAAFSKAVVWEYLESNPMKLIKAPKIPKSIPVFITIEEFKLIEANTPDQTLRNIFITAFNTGMRLSELVNMKWEWINEKENLIQIKNSKSFTTKSKKERIIPINSKVRAALNTQMIKQNSKYVFTNKIGMKFNQDYLTKSFKKVIRKLNLNDKIHFHSLRHSFASNLVQKGVSLYVVKELLGHEDLTTTQIYSHLQSENLRDAVNSI